MCVSGFPTGVHTSCDAISSAIRHGTLCYFRGMMLPGWILNGGLLVPVDALGLGVVRGGRLVVSRKRLRGACATPNADRCLMGPCRCSVSLLFPVLFGPVLGALFWFLLVVAFVVFCLVWWFLVVVPAVLAVRLLCLRALG